MISTGIRCLKEKKEIIGGIGEGIRRDAEAREKRTLVRKKEKGLTRHYQTPNRNTLSESTASERTWKGSVTWS